MLRPQTPPIDKREIGLIGDAAIPGERRIHTFPSPPPPHSLANEQSQVTSRCDVAHSGQENLHHFLPVLLQGMLPLYYDSLYIMARSES